MSSRSNSKSRIFFSSGGRFHLPWRLTCEKNRPPKINDGLEDDDFLLFGAISFCIVYFSRAFAVSFKEDTYIYIYLPKLQP